MKVLYLDKTHSRLQKELKKIGISNFFENLSLSKKIKSDFFELINFKKIVLTPHVAGWTFESEVHMVDIVLKKIKKFIE